MSKSKMTPLKDQMAAFKGLTEKEVIEMFERTTFKKLKAGDILLKENDADPMAFVILDGKIRVVQDPKENPQTIATFSKGDWIEGMSLRTSPLQTTSVIAAEPTRVMILDKRAVDSLNEKTQLSIYKRLAHLFSERIGRLQKNEGGLILKNMRLRKDIFNYRSQLKTDFHYLQFQSSKN